MPAQHGHKLAAEAFEPRELVRQARLAEEAGFDFVEISDHFHPRRRATTASRS
ncbi:LLM class flavin-dependent oxidoreductase [Agromyces sp. NPDC056523]|uniref:LLM class flavin-dependent oxidoreductase n=1 Tax=Agromyces sp. NPDC056523 TaxID=3345850 RepID=UPI00366C8407